MAFGNMSFVFGLIIAFISRLTGEDNFNLILALTGLGAFICYAIDSAANRIVKSNSKPTPK